MAVARRLRLCQRLGRRAMRLGLRINRDQPRVPGLLRLWPAMGLLRRPRGRMGLMLRVLILAAC